MKPFYSDDMVTLFEGDALEVARGLESGSVQTIVTSPPYFGLRDYGVDGQLGGEESVTEYVARMVALFRELRRVLADDGTLWLNLGDSMVSGRDVPPYGISGRAPEGSQGDDSSSSGRCDGCRAFALAQPRTTRNGIPLAPGSIACADAPSQDRTESHCPSPGSSGLDRPSQSEQSDPAKRDLMQTQPLVDEPPPASQGSTTPGSSRQLQGGSRPKRSRDVDPATTGSSSADVPATERRAGCTCGTAPSGLASSSSGRDAVALAYPDSTIASLHSKNLIGIPWRVAFALQADGWILRSDIIWAKPNPMPESVTDRPTKAHEYVFLFAKSPRYYYDAEAIKEPAVTGFNGSEFHTGKTGEHHLGRASKQPRFGGDKRNGGSTYSGNEYAPNGLANKRTVWTVPTVPFSEAHFAVYPPQLIRPCILAGSRPGDTVLDPFSGSGTTGMVATQEGRRYVGIDLNRDYLELSLRTRFAQPVLDMTGGAR